MIKNKLTKIFVFVFMLVIFDQVTGYLLHKLYFKQKIGQYYSLAYSFFHCHEEFLIFGNSRAQHHYDTRVFSELLHASCFNAGMDGGHSILLPYAQIKVMLERYAPKVIMIELNPAAFEIHERHYQKLSVLLPYYRALPQLRPLILLRGPFEKIKLISAIYPFNSNVIHIIRCNFIFSNPVTQRPPNDLNGYIPLFNRKIKESILKANIKKPLSNELDAKAADANLLEALKRIILLCRKKKTRLLLINSPIYHNAGEHTVSTSKAAKQVLALINREKAEFLDFSFEPAFAGRTDLFVDKTHLNEKGAAFFSEFLVKKTDLQNYFKTSQKIDQMDFK